MKVNNLMSVFCATLLLVGIIFPITEGIQIETKVDIHSSELERYINLEPLDDLPPSFTWRDRDGVDFTTPIRNQMPLPSCETFALVAAVETMVQYEVGYPFGCDLSEAHLFFYSGGNTKWGSYPENDTKFLVEHGVPDEACWPYPKDRYQYPLNTTSPDWQDRTVKISDWYYLPDDPVAIKTALVNNGPVPTYFHVYQDFPVHKKGIYRHRWGKSLGPHYVTIVGYNDDPGYWIVKNSWGTNYQEDGWFKIAYGECSMEKKSFYLTGVYGKFPIVYVDDDNTAGPWDGTEEHPYQTIQEAVDKTYEGYTIYVKNGTYYENLVINKTMKIDGEDKEITIIDGSGIGHSVEISDPNVRISGFTIQNSGTLPFDAGIKTLSLDSCTTIRNNIIQNNDIGIFLNYAYEEPWNIVQDNIIQNNRVGIYAHWSNNNKISGNTIKMNSEHGLEMERCRNSIIKGNIISDNGCYGIYLRGSSDENTINGINIIRNNTVGVKLKESNKNIITGNNFVNNTYQAYFNNAYFTKWRRNFWDDWPRLLPKIIRGHIGKRGIPWLNIDWLPKRNPY